MGEFSARKLKNSESFMGPEADAAIGTILVRLPLSRAGVQMIARYPR